VTTSDGNKLAEREFREVINALVTHGVIIEIQIGGTGERNRVLVSPTAYIDYWRGRAKGRAA
jgi:hypothetical protein